MPKTFILTDYWNEDRSHRPYRNHLHDPKTDEVVGDGDALEAAINEAGAVDGDEIEIIVRKTGRRPFGDWKVRLVEPHVYKREKRAQRRRKK